MGRNTPYDGLHCAPSVTRCTWGCTWLGPDVHCSHGGSVDHTRQRQEAPRWDRASTVAIAFPVGTLVTSSLAQGPQLGGPVRPHHSRCSLRTTGGTVDVSAAPLDSSSAAFIASSGHALHPDLGVCGARQRQHLRAPLHCRGQQPAKRTVTLGNEAESDLVSYPIPDEAITQPHWIEHGEPGTSRSLGADRHMLIVDKDNKYLYELYDVFWDGSKWDGVLGCLLRHEDEQPPSGRLDVGRCRGLAILPGLVRYDEVYGPTRSSMPSFHAPPGEWHVYPASHDTWFVSGALPWALGCASRRARHLRFPDGDAEDLSGHEEVTGSSSPTSAPTCSSRGHSTPLEQRHIEPGLRRPHRERLRGRPAGWDPAIPCSDGADGLLTPSRPAAFSTRGSRGNPTGGRPSRRWQSGGRRPGASAGSRPGAKAVSIERHRSDPFGAREPELLTGTSC